MILAGGIGVNGVMKKKKAAKSKKLILHALMLVAGVTCEKIADAAAVRRTGLEVVAS